MNGKELIVYFLPDVANHGGSHTGKNSLRPVAEYIGKCHTANDDHAYIPKSPYLAFRCQNRLKEIVKQVDEVSCAEMKSWLLNLLLHLVGAEENIQQGNDE